MVARIPIRPHHDFPAVAGLRCVRGNGCIRANVNLLGIREGVACVVIGGGVVGAVRVPLIYSLLRINQIGEQSSPRICAPGTGALLEVKVLP